MPSMPEMGETVRLDQDMYDWMTGLFSSIEGDQKGGPGSGHRGHRGRPGQRGGSQPRSAGSAKIDWLSTSEVEKRFPIAGDVVDGRTVRDDVPNLSSISASIDDWDELPGIRTVRFSDFDQMSGKPYFYSVSERERTEELAQAIRDSGEISPLIVVVDSEGPYVLEGGHRFDALRLLGATSFPALVVIDYGESSEEDEKGGPTSGHYGHSGRPGKRGGSVPAFTTADLDWGSAEDPASRVFSFSGTLYRAVDADPKVKTALGKATYFTNSPDMARMYGDDIREFQVDLGRVLGTNSPEYDRLHSRANQLLRSSPDIFKQYGHIVHLINALAREAGYDAMWSGPVFGMAVFDLGSIGQKGGPGSGHHGHSGRPGKRGGSLPGGTGSPTPKREPFIGVPADVMEVGGEAYMLYPDVEQPSGAPIRGKRIDPDDPRIPDTVYHMTTNLPAVRESGMLLARGAGGLGGDKHDQIVSMTIDRDIAFQLAEDTRFVAELADEFVESEPEVQYFRDVGEGGAWLRVSDMSPEGRRPWSDDLVNRLVAKAESEGWDFHGLGRLGGENNPGGFSNVQLRDYGFTDFIAQYFSMRQTETGRRNPVFLSTPKVLLSIDVDRVGVISIPRANLRTGALLTDFDLGKLYGLEEIRLYGDVPLDGGTYYSPEGEEQKMWGVKSWVPPIFPIGAIAAIRLWGVKGGKGSGHYGHRGRPGKRGGSAPVGSGGSPSFSPGVGRDARRSSGIYDVITETDVEGAKKLLTQGVEPTFKPDIPGQADYGPGRGIEREGLYVANDEAFSKGSFGKVRLYLTVNRDDLAVPQELVQLGHSQDDTGLDVGLSGENGAVTLGQLPKSIFSMVEVYDGSGGVRRMSPAEFLQSVGVSLDFPDLPTTPEYRRWLEDNADRLSLRPDQVDWTVHQYNRGSLDEMLALAQEAGLVGRKGLSIKGGHGSGHYGHAGRPGERGGSLPGSVAVSITAGRFAALRQEMASRIGYAPTVDAMSVATDATKSVLDDILEEDVREVLEKWESSDVSIRRSDYTAVMVLEGGRFKTQFETGHSGGTYDPEYRSQAENNGLGVPEDIDDRKRPVYGYLSDVPLTGVSMYGPIEFVLKPEVKQRVTATVSDSLGSFGWGEQVGVPLDQLGESIQAWGQSTWMMEQIADVENVGGDYIECQIHGGVSVSDIQRIVIHGEESYWFRGIDGSIEIRELSGRTLFRLAQEMGIEVEFSSDP